MQKNPTAKCCVPMQNSFIHRIDWPLHYLMINKKYSAPVINFAVSPFPIKVFCNVFREANSIRYALQPPIEG